MIFCFQFKETINSKLCNTVRVHKMERQSFSSNNGFIKLYKKWFLNAKNNRQDNKKYQKSWKRKEIKVPARKEGEIQKKKNKNRQDSAALPEKLVYNFVANFVTTTGQDTVLQKREEKKKFAVCNSLKFSGSAFCNQQQDTHTNTYTLQCQLFAMTLGFLFSLSIS